MQLFFFHSALDNLAISLQHFIIIYKIFVMFMLYVNHHIFLTFKSSSTLLTFQILSDKSGTGTGTGGLYSEGGL